MFTVFIATQKHINNVYKVNFNEYNWKINLNKKLRNKKYFCKTLYLISSI